jgi:hypothetical protein
VSRKGANTRTPIASPAHHTDQAESRSSDAIEPVATRTPTPIVALIVMLRSAPTNTSAIASRRRSSAGRKPIRASRVAATSGASVLPVAVTAAAAGDEVIGKLTRNAPIATPGHSREPKIRNEASAMPVGGHSGVMFCSTRATRRLSRAAT